MPDPIALNIARIVSRLLVDPRGWRVDHLMDELGIQPRTYRKYRALLSEFSELGMAGQWQVAEVRDGHARYLRLQPAEHGVEEQPGFLAHVATFWLARRVFAFAGRDLQGAVDGVWADLLDRVRDKPFWVEHRLRNTDRVLHYIPDAPKDYSEHGETLHVLLRSLFFARRVRFSYAATPGSGSPVQKVHKVCPLTLLLWKSSLYLVAAYTPEGSPYLFAVERMSEVETLDRFPYPSPADYDPARLFEGSFGIWQDPHGQPVGVELLFANQPWLHRYVQERTWHPSQSFVQEADGRLRMRFTVTSMVEVWPWLRSFGEDVQVVSPKRED